MSLSSFIRVATRVLSNKTRFSQAEESAAAAAVAGVRVLASHPHTSFAALGPVSPLEMAQAEGVAPRAAVPEEERMDRVLSNLRAGCSSGQQQPVSTKFAAVLVPLFEGADGEVRAW